MMDFPLPVLELSNVNRNPSVRFTIAHCIRNGFLDSVITIMNGSELTSVMQRIGIKIQTSLQPDSIQISKAPNSKI